MRAAGITIHDQWFVYLPVLVASVVFMVPLIIVAERGRMKPIFLLSVSAMGLSQVLLLLGAGGCL